MSRVRLHSRRGRWLLGFFACAVGTVGMLAMSGRGVKVAVYNDSGEPWSRATLTVGRETRQLANLPLHETGAVEVFAPQETAAPLELVVENSRVVHWRSPYLIQSNTARVTLHVNRWGEVQATVEQRVFSRLPRFMD